MLVEKLYGKSYAAALQDEIASPLQLTTLSKCAEPKPGEAPGYMRAPGGKLGQPPGVHHSQYLRAGGICATAADLVRWTHAYPSVPGVSDVVPRIVLGVPLPAPAAAPSAATPSATTTPAERTKLVGVYALTPQRTFEVTLENGELYVTPSCDSKQPLVFPSRNTYALGSSASTTTVTFIVENGVATKHVPSQGNDEPTRAAVDSSPHSLSVDLSSTSSSAVVREQPER